MISLARKQYVRWAASLLALLALVGLLGFIQGAAYAKRRATVQLANDSAFYSLNGMKALQDPQDRHLRDLFEGSLVVSAITLADLALKHPTLIKPSHYNLLVRICDYLKQYGHGPDTNPSFRPVAEVEAKVAEAVALLESIHTNPQEWEKQEDQKGDSGTWQ